MMSPVMNLVQRDDDQEETVKKRLAVYHEQTKPLIDFYQNWQPENSEQVPVYTRVDGVGSVDEITKQIIATLD